MSQPTLRPEHVHALLSRLESDDEFRLLFQADPAAGLAVLGAPAAAGACIHVRQLASKEVIAATRSALERQLTGTLAQVVHCLDTAFDATATVSARVRAA